MVSATLLLRQRLQIGREYVYDSTVSRLHSSGMFPINYISGQAAAECTGTNGKPPRLQCIDFALASFFGQGVVPNAMGPFLAPANDPDRAAILALFAGWNKFYAQYRGILTSPASLHLGRPTSRSLEVTAHLSPSLPERGMVTLYNPTSSPMAGDVTVPLYYANFAPGALVSVAQVAPGAAPVWVKNCTVGAEGAVYDIVFPYSVPSYAVFLITAA